MAWQFGRYAAALLMVGAIGATMTGAAAIDGTVFMETRGTTSPPIGFVQFCRKNLADCVGGSANPGRVAMTKARWDDLVAVNGSVNRAIEPVTDEELYGVAELWTYPTNGKGDCEDYVLQKRKVLLSHGWPASALLITVVRDTKNQGHAVLTVSTDRGDFVLDNQNPQVLPWSRTEYRFVKRQSPYDVARWETIEDRRTDFVASTSR
ncbi:transglutaminase-like cysteine peptidase [Prosthecomicrobium sp. N25]|uniref:transglutaminase-like cysteine peptidase n=1 Tax=Prosthecomicrobium sp. N25 TaxID=3129254 RepID=UPI003076C20F